MKTWGSRDIAPSFFTLALDGSGWSSSSLCCFTPLGKSPRFSLDRGLCGPQNRSERCGVEKNPLPLPGIKPRTNSSTLSPRRVRVCVTRIGRHMGALFLICYVSNICISAYTVINTVYEGVYIIIWYDTDLHGFHLTRKPSERINRVS
jgi:hypothetical protein